VAEVWDGGTGRRLLVLHAHEGTHEVYGPYRTASALFSSDGGTILTASDDRTVKLWDARTGRLRKTLHGFPPLVPRLSPLARARFSGDGRQVIGSAPWSDEALVWDVRSGRLTARLKGHSNNVASAEFSADGRFAVTTDRVDARLWDTVSGRVIAVFDAGSGYTGPQLGMFLPGGDSIALLEFDDALSVYRCEVCAPIAALQRLAKRRITRTLSGSERAKYLHE
jgi:WD40 repeat protein